MNVYQKLSKARVELLKRPLKKSGFNKYAGFEYFKLEDFLPAVIEIFDQLGLCSFFRIEESYKEQDDGVVTEYPPLAKLMIINTDKPGDNVTFSSETATAGMKGVQDIGAIHTYMRRYLWLSAMEITEDDAVDETAGKNKDKGTKESPKKDKGAQKPRKATAEQIKRLEQLFDGKGQRLGQMMEVYKIHTIDELTETQAASIIKRMETESAQVRNEVAA